jgi:hypothetical protein
MGDSEDVGTSVVLTYESTGVTPSARSVIYRPLVRLACTPLYSAVKQRGRGRDHVELSVNEYQVGDNDEILMVDGVHQKEKERECTTIPHSERGWCIQKYIMKHT